jgi:CRP-like cAMP-binding protein
MCAISHKQSMSQSVKFLKIIKIIQALKLTNPKQNRLLRSISDKDYSNIFPYLQLVSLDRGQELFAIGKRVDYIYFPTSALISIAKDLSNGLSMDSALVGKNSAVGLLLLDVDVSINRAYVNSAGFAYRMNKKVLLDEIRRGETIFEIWMTAIRYLSNQLSQNVICNRFHNVDQRLAKWVLMHLDALEINTLPVTHGYLSSSIGVRREAVTLSIKKMNDLGILRSTRGALEVLDLEKLKLMSCECYCTLIKLTPFRTNNEIEQYILR